MPRKRQGNEFICGIGGASRRAKKIPEIVVVFETGWTPRSTVKKWPVAAHGVRERVLLEDLTI
jgi:hypothetical protein